MSPGGRPGTLRTAFTGAATHPISPSTSHHYQYPDREMKRDGSVAGIPRAGSN
ncbi:hypothetical protein [Methanosphaerula subterraneus]|uniref:hypothetical protein n=1 Tax=Methanosphaerula subterraneus TaxID=3350244 RepID=UPI003F8752E2